LPVWLRAPASTLPFGRAGSAAIRDVVDPDQSPDTDPRTRDGEASTVVKLRVRAGESIQDAVRRFRKLCERSGLRKEMRRKAYYEKPSERRRREQLKRLRKARQASRV
jgi:small subunit ribosomal protein S21